MIRIDCRGLATEGLAQSDEIRRACDGFIKQGYAILDNVLPVEKVEALGREFNAWHASSLVDREAEDSLQVGRRRFMVPISFSGGFADPLVYANPYVLALVRLVLEPEAILEAYGAIVSLSGAEEQHIHPDGPSLFNSEIAALLPAHALTFALPLIEMNEHHGTTAIWPGSHRWQKRDEQAAPEIPVIPVGSCLLWDFRLHHSGTANRSERARPMVYATYARPWYRDPVNFKKATQRRLVFDPDFLEAVPAGARALFGLGPASDIDD